MIHVECYAGHRAEETPRRFYLDARASEVVDVLDRWLSPDHRYFKCLGNDDATYILRHDVVGGCWELTLYERSDLNSRHRVTKT